MLAKLMRFWGVFLIATSLFSQSLWAQVAETGVLGKSEVTLTPYDFLTAEELTTLRLLFSSEAALQIFVPEKGGYTALAVNSDEGFIRDGVVVASAIALTGFSDPGQAEAESINACESASKTKGKCEIVLTVLTKD